MGMIPEKDQWEAGQFAVISTADAYCYARFDFVYEAWDWAIEHMPKSLDDKEVTVVELTTTSKSDYSFWRKLEVSNFEKRLNNEPEDKWYVDEFGYPCREGVSWNKQRSNKPPLKSKSKPASKPEPTNDIKTQKTVNGEDHVYHDRLFESMILKHIAERISADLANSGRQFDVNRFGQEIILTTKMFIYPHGVELYDHMYIVIHVKHPWVYIKIYRGLRFIFSINVSIDGPIVSKPDEIDCPVKIDICFHKNDPGLEDIIKIIMYGVFGYIPDIPHKEEITKTAVIPYVNIAGQYYRCKTIIKEDENDEQ